MGIFPPFPAGGDEGAGEEIILKSLVLQLLISRKVSFTSLASPERKVTQISPALLKSYRYSYLI